MRIEKKIDKISKIIKRKISSELLSEEITGKQYYILQAIEELGEVTPAKLADTLKRDRSTIADIVRRLIAKGLLEKKKNQEDGRSYTVTLTKKSLEKRMIMKEKKEKAVNEIFCHLSKEETDLLHNILDKIIIGGEKN